MVLDLTHGPVLGLTQHLVNSRADVTLFWFKIADYHVVVIACTAGIWLDRCRWVNSFSQGCWCFHSERWEERADGTQRVWVGGTGRRLDSRKESCGLNNHYWHTQTFVKCIKINLLSKSLNKTCFYVKYNAHAWYSTDSTDIRPFPLNIIYCSIYISWSLDKLPPLIS